MWILGLRIVEGSQDPKPQNNIAPDEDVLSTIERMNKGAQRSLRHGDIVVNKGRSVISCPDGNCFWPKSANGLVYVPYTLDHQFSGAHRAVIERAMLEYTTLTCVRFVPRANETDYLDIIADYGCWSSLGRTGGPQEVSLEIEGCILNGVVQHELNHALGFEHEHCRSDRDSYVKILWPNILPEYSSGFFKVNTTNLGLEYDYSSVMHYGKFAYTTSYIKQTIQPIPNNEVVIGQRLGLSNLDVAKINRLYNCNACSSVLTGLQGEFSSGSYPSTYSNNNNCTWLIRLPRANNKVLLEFMAFDVQSSPGCVADYIRVFDGPSRMSPRLLDKSCGTRQLPSLMSSGTVMLVEFVTDDSVTATGFKAKYSMV